MRQPDRTPRYPIRAVSKITGLGIDTLRVWERRYQAVSPTRDDRGRMYSDADVERLHLIRQAVAGGHRVGRIARLPEDELRRLVRPPERQPSIAQPRRLPDVARLATALNHFDGAAIDREFSQLAATLPPLELVRDALMPTLARVAQDCHGQPGGIAREHLVAATLRNLLGSLLRLFARPDDATRLLFATTSGDRHEIGTLGAALIAASSGFAVSYLGPDVPARDIVAAAKSYGARVLVLGSTVALKSSDLERELRVIVRALPSSVEVWIGGRGAARQAALIGTRGHILSDFTSYHAQLVRLSAQAR